MLKKSFLLFVLLVFIFLTSGCNTVVKGTSGFVQGATSGFSGFIQGTKEGAKQDWESIKNTDTWIKDNLW